MFRATDNVASRPADGKYPAGTWCQPSRSGSQAFDEYRNETLRRLEDEQREFQDFLRRLRQAKDKAEFDQFIAEQRDRTGPSSAVAQLKS